MEEFVKRIGSGVGTRKPPPSVLGVESIVGAHMKRPCSGAEPLERTAESQVDAHASDGLMVTFLQFRHSVAGPAGQYLQTDHA
jgi:hypothetical protein